MINITEPIHVLTYRFQNESIYHKEYGNYTDLRDFVNDFNSLDILALLNCHYIKKNKQHKQHKQQARLVRVY